MKSILSTALLATAGFAIVTSSASAITANDGDIYIGFRENGSAQDYLIDVGQPDQFETATSPITLSLGNFASDLRTVFGNSWYANNGIGQNSVLWGVVGGVASQSTSGNDYAGTLYASTPGANWSSSDSGSQAIPANNIFNGLGAFYQHHTNSTNAPLGQIQTSASTGSWASYNTGTQSFGTWIPTIEGVVTNNIGFDLLAATDNGANGFGQGAAGSEKLGTFSLNVSGSGASQTASVTFTPAPEPSSFVLLSSGLAGFLGFVRRRSNRA